MQKMLMDMDRGYESSDEENENDNENTPSQSADVLTNGATSHRFNERNEDEDEDEEGMVLDSEEVVVSGTHWFIKNTLLNMKIRIVLSVSQRDDWSKWVDLRELSKMYLNVSWWDMI